MIFQEIVAKSDSGEEVKIKLFLSDLLSIKEKPSAVDILRCLSSYTPQLLLNICLQLAESSKISDVWELLIETKQCANGMTRTSVVYRALGFFIFWEQILNGLSTFYCDLEAEIERGGYNFALEQLRKFRGAKRFKNVKEIFDFIATNVSQQSKKEYDPEEKIVWKPIIWKMRGLKEYIPTLAFLLARLPEFFKLLEDSSFSCNSAFVKLSLHECQTQGPFAFNILTALGAPTGYVESDRLIYRSRIPLTTEIISNLCRTLLENPELLFNTGSLKKAKLQMMPQGEFKGVKGVILMGRLFLDLIENANMQTPKPGEVFGKPVLSWGDCIADDNGRVAVHSVNELPLPDTGKLDQVWALNRTIAVPLKGSEWTDYYKFMVKGETIVDAIKEAEATTRINSLDFIVGARAIEPVAVYEVRQIPEIFLEKLQTANKEILSKPSFVCLHYRAKPEYNTYITSPDIPWKRFVSSWHLAFRNLLRLTLRETF